MTRDTAISAKELLQLSERADVLYDNIALLKEDGGTLTFDFEGKSTGRVLVFAHSEDDILTAIQNGLQELILECDKRIEEL